MVLQNLVAICLVLACSLYALWVLMPAALRVRVATSLLRLPLPLVLVPALRRAASASGACDCSGCDKVVGSNTGANRNIIRIVPHNKT